MRLVTTWYGTFLLDDNGELVGSTPFPRKADEVGERLRLIREGEVLDEELSTAPREVAFEVAEDRLLSLEGAVRVTGPVPTGAIPAPEDLGFDPSVLREASLDLATASIKDALPADQPVVLYLRAMDQVDREATRSLELLRYWHSFHFPELGALVDDATFLTLIKDGAQRERILDERADLDPGVDAGRPLGPGEGKAMSGLAGHILGTMEEARRLRVRLEEAIVESAPNLAALAGPLVGARLINLAGSLERLARLPSSTVQLLGAERALFLHIREGAPAPKHGVIFQHPVVHSSPPWLRGRIARALAGKISIAARADAYGTHEDGGLGRELRDAFLARAQDLRVTHPQPPPGWKRRRPWDMDQKRRARRGRKSPPRSRKHPRGGRRGVPKRR
jgi:nucleolar protein 56